MFSQIGDLSTETSLCAEHLLASHMPWPISSYLQFLSAELSARASELACPDVSLKALIQQPELLCCRSSLGLQT